MPKVISNIGLNFEKYSIAWRFSQINTTKASSWARCNENGFYFATRKIIEATGSKDAQKILSEDLTDQIIKVRSIESFIELSKSINSKVIITDGKVPYLIQ